MTTAITGASGHIGGNLVRALIKQGKRVRALARQDRRALEGLDLEIIEGDVQDVNSLVRLCKGAETVFHLAARISIIGGENGLVEKINHQGTCNIVEACLQCGVRRLVHFSSIHAFDNPKDDSEIRETRQLASGKSCMSYDRTKAMGQMEACSAVNRGLDVVIVNPTSVIGPYDFKPSRMGQVLIDLYQNRMPALVNGGYNWVDVRDVVAGALAAEIKGRTGESYLLSGHWVHFNKLADLVCENSGKGKPLITLPLWTAALAAPFALSWAKLFNKMPKFTPDSIRILKGHRNISSEKAMNELGYSMRPLDETVRDALEWFKEARMLK
jgi:dihydroflavonol-4-reductase